MGQIRTRIMNQLQALAMNEGYRWKRKLFSEEGRALLDQEMLSGLQQLCSPAFPAFDR
jgi:hypothetical protein